MTVPAAVFILPAIASKASRNATSKKRGESQKVIGMISVVD